MYFNSNYLQEIDLHVVNVNSQKIPNSQNPAVSEIDRIEVKSICICNIIIYLCLVLLQSVKYIKSNSYIGVNISPISLYLYYFVTVDELIFFFRIVFGLFFVMNLVLWSKGSSGAVPFSTLVALLALWFCVSVPLTFIGAYFGFRKRVRLTDNLSVT